MRNDGLLRDSEGWLCHKCPVGLNGLTPDESGSDSRLTRVIAIVGVGERYLQSSFLHTIAARNRAVRSASALAIMANPAAERVDGA